MTPIPRTRRVGKTMRFLKREKPTMPRKQKVAISLDTARRAGAKIKPIAKLLKPIARPARPSVGGIKAGMRKTAIKSRVEGIKTEMTARRAAIKKRVAGVKTRMTTRRAGMRKRITNLKRRKYA